MENGLAFADYAVIVSFFTVMIGIGLYFRSRMNNIGMFFGGGKQIPWWLGGISFYMCSFSALAFVIYSALAWQYGFIAVTIVWVSVPGSILSAYFFAARWRRITETSPLEYIEVRYGNKMRQSLVWLGIPAKILDDGLKLLAIGTIIATGLGLPLRPAVIISGIIIILYTSMGGLWAAMVADFIQFIVLFAGVIVLPFLAISRVGGVAAFIEQVPQGFFSFTAAKYSWSYILVFFFIILLNYSTSWALVQRYYSAGSDNDARKVGYLVAVLNIVGAPIFYLPAMAARLFLPDIQNYNDVYAILCKALLPVGMLGMIIAAMFSATMSTLAGEFNAIASVLTNDLYKRMISANASPQRTMLVARLNTVIVGAVVIAIAFFLMQAQGSEDLFRVMVRIFSLFLPPFAIPMLLGMLTKKISDFGGLCGLFVGITAGLAFFAVGSWFPIFRNEQVLTLSTSFTTLLGLYLGTIFKPNPDYRKEIVDGFMARVNLTQAPSFSDSKSDTAHMSPFPVIGVGVIAVGLTLAVSVLLTEHIANCKLSLIVGLSMVLAGFGFWTLGRMKKTAGKNEKTEFAKSESNYST